MRIALIIGVWMIALAGGVLLYTAQQTAGSVGNPENTATVANVIAEAEAAIEDAAPGAVAFSLPDMDGNARDINEWSGKYRVLNFWATWCAPCRREIPLLKTFQDEHVGDDIQVIGIAVDFMEDVTRYAEKAQFNYPVLVGQEDAMAVAESSGVPFIGLPFTMIVDNDGQLIDTHMGEIFEDDLKKLAETLKALDDGTLSLEEARQIL
ncbi:MAG: TlpA disulfide reductase family protein [Pseudomonadota bacterium]